MIINSTLLKCRFDLTDKFDDSQITTLQFRNHEMNNAIHLLIVVITLFDSVVSKQVLLFMFYNSAVIAFLFNLFIFTVFASWFDECYVYLLAYVDSYTDVLLSI